MPDVIDNDTTITVWLLAFIDVGCIIISVELTENSPMKESKVGSNFAFSYLFTGEGRV